MLVGAGARHREQIPGPDVGGQFDVTCQLVVGMATGHRDEPHGAQLVAVRQDHSVFRTAERDLRVVGHASVHADERSPARLRPHRHHAVERHHRPGTDRASLVDHDAGPGEPLGRTRLVQRIVDDRGELAEIRLKGVDGRWNRVLAADVQFGEDDPVRGADVGHRGDHPVNRFADTRPGR